jgi:hypothetical protein
MGFYNDEAVIIQKTVDKWNVNNPVIPAPHLNYPNVEDEKPDNEIWARLTIQGGNRTPLGSTNRSTSGIGSIIFQIFIPLHQDIKYGLRLADHISDMFDVLDLGSSIWTDATKIEQIGVDNDTWYQINTTTIFHSIHRKC